MKKPSAISRIAVKFSDPRNVSKAVETQKTRRRGQSAYEAPANPTEETLSAIWSKLLAIDKVGRNDNFFLAGGHSLLATQMLARVRDAYRIELPLKALFESPVLASFAEKIESSRISSASVESPAPQPRSDTTPLSFAQQRLWFLDQLAPGNPSYNIPQRYRLRGNLSREALQASIDAVVRRQESLRTTFAQSDAGPVQIIAPNLRLPVRYVDVTHLEENSREAEALRFVQEEATTPFDLAAGPLLRVLMVKLADDLHEMVLNAHHIVYDRWSHGILMEEIGNHYRAECEGTRDPMPPLPLQYADFAIWQRRYLEGNVLRQQVEYWKERLTGAPALIAFPTDRPRTEADRHRGAIEETVLADTLVLEMRRLCQEEGATLFMGLLAAFNLLLSRYSGLEDIVVGSPIANRNLTEIEPLIGFFVSTLALRTDLSGNPPWRELLRRTRETCLGAYANDAVPFERLVEELRPDRSLSHTPIFQVAFALQPAPVQAIELPELRMERQPLHTKTSIMDVAWFAFELNDGVLLRVEYDTDLYDRDTISRAIRHYRTLLEAIVANPGKRLYELPLLTDAEERQLLVEWNATSMEYPRGACAHELLEAQAERTPNALAAASGDRQLTYRELNERANRLAHYLRRLGAGPGTLVAICMPRSLETIVAILAVLKAGGAYLPLDPAYPNDRLAFLLEDSQAPVLLTQATLSKELPDHAAQEIHLDDDWSAIGEESVENPSRLTQSSDLAYVIYTSGSTGRPKGVMIEHRSLVNLISWHRRQYNVQPRDRATQLAGLAFDASVWEIFPYLTAGASLHLADDETRISPESLLRWLKREQITLSFLPTPLAEGVLDVLKTADAKGLHLRAVLTGGDKLNRRPGPQVPFELVNHYGPTESTVVTSCASVASSGSDAPPIGKPIANTIARILDAYGNLVPIGVSGELYIGGEGLARGYWRRPELTEERFVPDPFSNRVGDRLYRTGDRVRYLPDGNLQFLGRLDHQVKIRGFRIELGEIENTLDSHPGVLTSVAAVREDVPGEKRLVAYVVAEPDYRGSEAAESAGALSTEQISQWAATFDEAYRQGANAAATFNSAGWDSSYTGKPIPSARAAAKLIPQLRLWLSAKLPEYMVPQAFVLLDAMPLSQNGKIDRKALPAPGYSPDGAEYVAPRTPAEQKLAEIWSAVLQAPRVGARDNFFALGGHSLLAIQVVSRVRLTMGADLPLRSVFESPTLEALAARIAETARSVQLAAIPRVPRNRPLPLSSAQERLWFLDQLAPDNSYYSAPLAMRLKGPLDADALRDAVNRLIRRHEVLRTAYQLRNDRPVQVIAPELAIDLPVIDVSDSPAKDREEEARRRMIVEARRPFDLRTGPVVRAFLLRLDELDHALLLNIHHIATDGWSIWPFIQELGALYEACLAGKPSPLPELPIQYADFSVWHREWLESETLAQQTAYWKKQLAGAPDRIELPTDRPRPAVQTYRGAVETVLFPIGLLNDLRALAKSENATLYMILLAAFQTLLFRYTGQENIVVGSPTANRTRAEIEDLVGFFVNTLAMHSDLSGNPAFRELLQRVREVALGAFSNQDLPFEKLVEAIAPDRDLSANPLVQVLFVLQNPRRSILQLAGVEFESMQIHNGTTKFDIAMFLVERPEGLLCWAEYSTDLFDAATICRLLGHFRVLLEAIVENPGTRIGELRLLEQEERKQVLAAAEGARIDYPRDRCLHEFIEEQAERTPDAPALVFESHMLSYRELNERANRLAHRLRGMGAGPDVLVAICAERSVEIVVGLLGILKAGAAYVPIDPEYPRERLALMLADAEAPVLLTLERLLDLLPEPGIPVICLDRDWQTLAGEPAVNPPLVANGRDQAYAIYTSGSTGKPKGVPNVHEAIVNRLLWMQDAYRLNAGDRVLQKTPYSFDVSVWEFFWPLMTGACLVLARPGGHKDPDYLVNLIAERAITTIHFVPSMLRIFLESEHVAKCTSLRRVFCSGEALPFELQQRFFELLSAELHNLYGPTEAAVDVTSWRCDPASARSVVPIGRPIWNTRIYVLDRFLQPVPFGIPGELHIGGAGLARGYLKRPELTAEKFIRDPFHDEPGARLYKTGDLARTLSDGTVEYLGRLDHQVKIRGFRIELGEIENTLDSHPGVLTSVAAVREDEPGEKRLVAYVVAEPDYRGSEAAESAGALSTEQVSQWAATFDEAYRQGANAAATFNIAGWDSSYTGKPIPSAEMKVWVESTADRILALKPRRVWEIGCGTGLLLFRVAPHCERYYGTDVSRTALDFLAKQLQRPELNLPQVRLERKPGHEFAGTPGQFDTVVLNSVAQYFPDLDYFQAVVAGAVAAVGAEGSVYLGDLRSLPLLEMFQTSVRMCQAPDAMTAEQIRRRVRLEMAQEGELLIDPEFFEALRHRLPKIRRVEIQLKRGRAHNELTRFRYDVTLHIGGAPAPKADCPWVDWRRESFSLDLLREALYSTQPDMLGLTGVPNARLRGDAAALEALRQTGAGTTAGELREVLKHTAAAVDPEDLWALERELPYRVEIRASQKQVDGCCDVVVRKIAAGGPAEFAEPRYPGEPRSFRPLASYANNPLRRRAAARLIPQLRLWLSAKLPEYMLPQAFVLLDAMPLSQNGKIDRKALPAPDQSRPDSSESYIPPRTQAEEVVATIMADVLRLERVGAENNFFALGGHSLSATQVVARVRAAFGLDLSVRALFEAPTVAALTQAIERLERSEHGLVAPPIARTSRGRSLPLSFAQQRLWFLDQMEPDNPFYSFPWTSRLSGALNVAALETALNGIVRRHEILRTIYRTEQDLPVQVVRPETHVPLELRDLSALPTLEREGEARRIVQEEAAKPFRLASDIMFRSLLLKLDERDHVLFVNTHHIASDGWSMVVMQSELAALYQAALTGEDPVLPDLPIQYADYAVWQRTWLQGEVLEKQLAYWKSRLNGVPPVLSFSNNRPRPTVQGFRGAMERVTISKKLADQIDLLSRQEAVTPFMTMLAAFQTLILYLTNQSDIVLGTDLAGRTSLETEALIGFFVNLMVLRTDLSGDPSFSQLLGRVREVTLNAYAHQDVPFDKLVEELQPERSMSRNPLVQVLFVHLNTPLNSPSLPGIELSGFPMDLPSKFDLAVFCRNSGTDIAGTWVYNPDLFDPAMIARMAGLYQVILEAVTANPGRLLSEIVQSIAASEQQQRTTGYKEFQEASRQQLKSIRRKPVKEPPERHMSRG